MIENNNIPITKAQTDGLKYLALGDSYTIGEGERTENSYPFLVEKMLEKEGFNFSFIKVIAKTGWTSGELLDAVNQENIGANSFDIASLLIGVNNQYRNQTLDQFKKELIELIVITQGFLGDNNQKNLVLISIPDWGVTSFAQSAAKPQHQIKKEIDAFNAVIKDEASKYGLHFLNITNSYREIGGLEKNLVTDGLHPSKHIYSQWAYQIREVFKGMADH
ncbi:GDSL-type esterase/lipase family protein [uncultured Cyclobacterium sp.]|uniref:SGNH/GDSL hydrolase family protein n=1 Tax=uncultured Cyclobacterium sp. TaxID=453820 RepID=UPI0030ECF06C|tara:strand:+ start:47580 stop:48239 length:660 start_codon:yes stop_codon:yes gene_type:complete